MATIDVRVEGADEVGLRVSKLTQALNLALERADDVQGALNGIRFFAGGVEVDETPRAKVVWVVLDHRDGKIRGIHETREGAEATQRLLECAEPKPASWMRFNVSQFGVEKWEVGN